uniref:Uncharacterized protein n=1 Tax=Desertifilum tharense IPPAS B-1220 TaxID=1781255 RepID=A0A1E5QQN4_9CYAN|nr:hypothetical protein BH720_01970 [Desertifilum tharense IPPAS B-1220]
MKQSFNLNYTENKTPILFSKLQQWLIRFVQFSCFYGYYLASPQKAEARIKAHLASRNQKMTP